MKDVIFWLSGTSHEVLNKCGEPEQRKYIAVGLTVFIPAIMAFIAGQYTVSIFTDNIFAIYIISIIWAFFVLLIDIVLLATARPIAWDDGLSISSLIIRLCIAIILGLSISHPVVLYIFKDEISAKIESRRLVELEEIRASYRKEGELYQQEKETLYDEWAKLSNKQARELQKYQSIDGSLTNNDSSTDKSINNNKINPTSKKSNSNLKIKGKPNNTLSNAEKKLKNDLDSLLAKRSKFEKEQSKLRKEFTNEVYGNGLSGKPGYGVAARKIENEINVVLVKIQNMDKNIESINIQIDKIRTTRLLEYEKTQQATRKKEQEEEARLRNRQKKLEAKTEQERERQYEIMSKSYQTQLQVIGEKLLQKEKTISELNNQRDTAIAALSENPKQDILAKTLALDSIFQNKEEGGDFARSVYYILTILFVLIDMVAIIAKSLAFHQGSIYAKLLKLHTQEVILKETNKHEEIQENIIYEQYAREDKHNIDRGKQNRNVKNTIETTNYEQLVVAKATREVQSVIHKLEAKYDKQDNVIKHSLEATRVTDFVNVSGKSTENFINVINNREKITLSVKDAELQKTISDKEKHLINELVEKFYEDHEAQVSSFFDDRQFTNTSEE
ncbi:DUF4407 domain-containing protein [Candidatus Albibeggiatoa sp. nov. BB20]|uniref:DUF4407 domain-containing protein n=1 Tax=Candidatus Albibeggiatoa sp. nov. BB20 TaxID=3162723 RepID=UPI00336535E5